MSRYTRRAGKRDSIEPEVIAMAKKYGWLVQQLDPFDLLCHRRGETILVEVKSGNRPLTESQKNLIRCGWPLNIISSAVDAEELFA